MDVLGKALTKRKKIALNDFHKRLLWTLILLAFWNVLRHVGVPGIDFEALTRRFHESSSAFPRLTIFSLGLMPYISAYILIEVLALFLQPLKKWRAGGYAGRGKLVQVARLATLVLALVQGYFIAQSVESMGTVYEPGVSFKLIFILTLTAGTFLTLWIADMITSRGIGHGISLLIFAGYANAVPFRLSKIFAMYEGENILRHFLGVAFVVIGLVVLVVLVERSYRKLSVKFHDGAAAYVPIKLTTAGIIPAEWTASPMMWIGVLLGYFHFESSYFSHFSESIFSFHEIGYYLVYFVVLLIWYYLLTVFFYRPKKLVNDLKTLNATFFAPSPQDKVSFIKRNLYGLAFIGSVYLFLFTHIWDILLKYLDFPLDGLALIVVVVIALDVWGELRMRWYKGSLVKVAELQEPLKAGLLSSLLKSHKIPCHLQGYYHRALLYFFGPYIEISVLVPENRAMNASEVIQGYLKLA